MQSNDINLMQSNALSDLVLYPDNGVIVTQWLQENANNSMILLI